MNEEIPLAVAKERLACADVEGFDVLAELALDIRSSWNHSADKIWQQLDPELWDFTHNPWAVLQTVSREKLQKVLDDADFRKILDDLVQERRDSAEAPAWFQKTYPQTELKSIAYFSMEFMLSEALPIYSGGLGNVAGDQLKAAHDLGVPVTGVGLLYQQGYFRQVIDNDGSQQALFPFNDPGQLPVTPLRYPNGEWLRLQLDLPGHPICVRCWQVQVGRLKLYLLDSNDPANYPPYRGITSELYGGDTYQRIMQEIVLGIGGWRLLSALGEEPDVCHLNEGHAAFAVLERARSFMQHSGQPFDVALTVTRAGNLFTTHTAVDAGFDRFPPELIERCLGGYAQTQLGITTDELLALGRLDPSDTREYFCMAKLATRGSGAVNGVSSLHGRVSRHLFSSLFPRWPIEEVPVGHVTNGVHMPTWDSAAADKLWTKVCGKNRWLGTTETLEEDIHTVSDTELWEFRTTATHTLVTFTRDRLSKQLAAAGATADEVNAAKYLLDPNRLTIGFARRFASYKRPNLLLHDRDRLLRLLSNTQHPVQIIIAGKAHPADATGQALIQEWTQFIRQPEVRPYAIFLSDYDMLLTEHLVQGVDVWLNTPRRPWEASGTSGMKVLVNGGLNLSELDGWWAEAYTPEVGWALGDGLEHDDVPAWDAAEANALYDLLENKIVPEFYTRNDQGVPIAWVARMRESMSQLTPNYSSNRTVREYVESYYLPAAINFKNRVADNGMLGATIVDCGKIFTSHWPTLRFDKITRETVGGQYQFEVHVYLDELNPDTVQVELYASGMNGSDPERHVMERLRKLIGSDGGYCYRASVPAERPAADYTARIVPASAHIAVPLEDDHILWEK